MKPPHSELEDDAATRVLVDALRTDGPSDAARARMRAALGIAAVATTSAAATTAGASAGASGGAVGTTASASAASSTAGGAGTAVVTASVAPKTAAGLLFAKWGVVAAVGGVVALSAGTAALSARRPRPPVDATLVASPPPRGVAGAGSPAPSTARRAEEAAPTADQDRAAAIAEPPPREPRTTRRAATAASATEAEATSARGHAAGEERSLSDELSTIDEARDALAAGRPRDALDALDRYDLRFPSGALAPEAGVLRVDAWLAAGRRDEARAAARRFADRYGDTPQTRRIEARLSGADAP